MTWIDTHCHLASENLIAEFEPIFERALEASVQKMVNVSYNFESAQQVLEQCQKFPTHLFPAVGIQPHDSQGFQQDEAFLWENLLFENPQVIAVGEIGLDIPNNTPTQLEKQILCFEYFLNLALDHKKPVIIHVRNTHAEVFPRLKKFAEKGGTGVIHCFTGTKEEAKDFLDLNFFVSFSGIVTFKNAAVVQESAKYVPIKSIFIETDSPYLAPMPLRGKRNEPSFLPHTAAFLAQLKEVALPNLSAQLETNFNALFFKNEKR